MQEEGENLPVRLPVNPDKHLHSTLYVNPRVVELYDLKDFSDKI